MGVYHFDTLLEAGNEFRHITVQRTALELVIVDAEFETLVASVEAGKYDDAREYLWTQYLDIPEEIKASINVHRVQLMNAYVNPANYASILNEMRDGIKGLVEAGKFDEARAFLAGIAPVGGFTKNLNESLYNVKNTIVAMDIAEDGAQVLVNDAGAMLYDYLASKVYEDKFLAAGELFKPRFPG